MVPAITACGRSFRGAALYYAHDKRQPGEAIRLTTERVAWVETVNLPTGDPERAWRIMAHTALAQGHLTHCNIGANFPGQFFSCTGSGFGSMCLASSPKDPMFWRWHGFIDLMYRNYCALKGLTCHVAPAPAADPWMGDNAADIAAGGVPPSPGPHWMSPDIWNRTAPVTTDSCIPRTTPPDLNTVGGVTRNCGSEAEHENPVAGQPNFLY